MSPDKLDARMIVRKAGMRDSPGYYSGRGAILSDLNPNILGKVYEGVQREYGRDAAKQFVKMVEAIPNLSATDFLLSFYRLEGNGWKMDERVLGNEKGIFPEDECSALGTVLSVMSGMSEKDETSSIREEFLRKYSPKEK